MVTISTKEYTELVAARDKLNALEAGGVDNWDFYWDSMKDAGLLEDDSDEEE
jgi:hypothetical protein